MARRSIGRIAQKAPTLKDLIVLSMPDCLLIEGWSASGADIGMLASLMGSIVHAGRQTAQGTTGRANPEMITIETPDGLIIVVPMGKDFAAGFVYERSTTLGLARIQIRDALLELESLLRGPEAITKPPPAVPLPVAMGQQQPEVEQDLPVQQMASATSSSAPTERRAFHSIETVPDSVPVMSAPTGFGSKQTPVDPIEPVKSPAVQPVQTIQTNPVEEARPASLASDDGSARSRAVQLLEYLQRNAPDPHVSLLRLSLRTGIALERLDRPDLLTDEQVETMAASIREIVGQEQSNPHEFDTK